MSGRFIDGELGTLASLANSTQTILLSWLTQRRIFRQVWTQCQHGDSDTSFTFGIGPSKSAAMIFGPRRNLPACNLTLGGVALPVVTKCKYLGVVFSPTLSWAAHVQHVVDRGNYLHNACLGAVPNAFRCTRRHPSSWCTSWPALLGARNSWPHHPLPSRVWIVRCAGGVGSSWVGPLVRPMLVSW